MVTKMKLAKENYQNLRVEYANEIGKLYFLLLMGAHFQFSRQCRRRRAIGKLGGCKKYVTTSIFKDPTKLKMMLMDPIAGPTA